MSCGAEVVVCDEYNNCNNPESSRAQGPFLFIAIWISWLRASRIPLLPLLKNCNALREHAAPDRAALAVAAGLRRGTASHPYPGISRTSQSDGVGARSAQSISTLSSARA